jgi:hypothetical protein
MCRCAVCELEVWLQGEIAVIRPDTETKRNLCPHEQRQGTSDVS